MADNIDVNDRTGTSKTVSADEVAGTLMQNVKVDVGGNGATSPLVRGQQNDANSLPVTLSTEAVVILTAMRDALQLLDDMINSDRARVEVTQPLPAGTALIGNVGINGTVGVTGTVAVSGTTAVSGTVAIGAAIPAGANNIGSVNLITGQTGIAAGAGAASANTPRFILASDDPAVTAIGVMTDWDESDRAKVNLIAGQAGISAGAGAIALNTPRVTLGSDDPAVVALQVMDDWDESDRAKVNIIVGQAGISAGAGAVAVNTPRMTLASDDPAVGHLNTLAGAVSSTKMRSSIIDALPAGGNTIGKVSNDVLTDFGAGESETIAASQTDQVLGATGATGDYLNGLLVVPASTSPGAVSIKDGAGSAITMFEGGTDSVSNLVSFFIPVNAISGSGAWSVTTGANVSVFATGNFT